MDTAWIQVFVLTMSECVAPAGKTVCQEQEYQLTFATAESCEMARDQFVLLKSQSENIIVNRALTRCTESTIEGTTYASREEAIASINGPAPAVAAAESAAPEQTVDFTASAHQERLANLSTCEDSKGVAPCKIGEIIIEGESVQKSEVWRRDPR